MGHLTSTAFPTLENLIKNLSPRVRMFAFFALRIRTKSHHSVCSAMCSTAIKVLKESFFNGGNHFFYIYTKALLLATRFQY